MKKISCLIIVSCLFTISISPVWATPPSTPEKVFIKEILVSKDTIYLTNEESFISSDISSISSFSNYQFSINKILANLDDFQKESKVKLYLETTKGIEVVLKEDTIESLTSKKDYFHFFQGDTLRYQYATQHSLGTQVRKTPACTSDQVNILIDAIYHKKTIVPKEMVRPEGDICDYPQIRFPQVDISKIYNFSDKKSLDNSKLTLKIDNTIYRQYLLGYQPGVIFSGPNYYFTNNNLFYLAVIGLIISISTIFLIIFLRNKKKKKVDT
ncbi:MAG: hypothetical protein A2126_03235 [Candidatus Woykebacteria bacterium GWB1_45_5]|uniref:Uncharacterized protein n=2 Tax=Candidatus Woykeibacteriota TaxID=1817899 RepID=A0A1G1W231_9BACT|nr:MAG: hypothetical protein A2113_03730 [Candidatus Woykebacteria bacterium GWA1_44_8]OGY23591.1 MAG: hypothetical protein A2126_03235 [Candidatus Woykebacteria bacterium GWB1_45_5]